MRSYTTTKAISAAMKFHGPCASTDTCVDISYDKEERCWYARYMQLTSEWKYRETGNIGFGPTPMDAVLSLQENNLNQSN